MTHVLISLTKQIHNALDNNKFACDVFLDLRKPFKTVHQKILLFKLEYYGIHCLPLPWFKDYLKNRYKFTSINGVKSTPIHGVPQGSI